MKNDKKKLGKVKSLLSSFSPEKVGEEEEDKEEDADEEENSAKRNCLKQELDEVLKGIREIGKETSEDEKEEENEDVTKEVEDLDSKPADEAEFDVGDSEIERSTSRISDVSDITLALDESIDSNDNEISDNTLEEISAL